jgi:hypothetical protein
MRSELLQIESSQKELKLLIEQSQKDKQASEVAAKKLEDTIKSIEREQKEVRISSVV